MAENRNRWQGWLQEALDLRRSRRRLRDLSPLEPIDAIHVRREGRDLVSFSTNDYLGLSSHPAVAAAASRAAARWGNGPRGSALVCGYTELHEALEEDLARLESKESALLCPTGWAANCGTLAALAGPDLDVFSDELNHASIIDGCRLASRSGARVRIYRHRDADHLERLLAESVEGDRELDRSRRRLVVTDTLFSMDGNLAPLDRLVDLKDRWGAWLMIDEAHATLLYGDGGAGWAEESRVQDRIDVHVGTLSKAIGAQGGFVAGSRDLRRWLLNAVRPFVFSTALPLPVVAAARAALAVRRDEPEIVDRLWNRVDQLSDGLGRARARSPIQPVMVGEEQAALDLSRELLEAGLWVPAIRPPTVPVGTARLRVTVSAAHRSDEVAALVAGIGRWERAPAVAR